MNDQKKIIIGVLSLLLLGGTWWLVTDERRDIAAAAESAALTDATFGAGRLVTLYRTPSCGCCLGYAEALETVGFTVTVESMDDLEPIKTQYGIPPDKTSCHTSVIDGYVVEGHVPLAAVEKLLTERPDVAGIGLPFMPSGTPGMPGPKLAPYKIYQLADDGAVSPYLTL